MKNHETDPVHHLKGLDLVDLRCAGGIFRDRDEVGGIMRAVDECHRYAHALSLSAGDHFRFNVDEARHSGGRKGTSKRLVLRSVIHDVPDENGQSVSKLVGERR